MRLRYAKEVPCLRDIQDIFPCFDPRRDDKNADQTTYPTDLTYGAYITKDKIDYS
jgi:hypothetical protein